MVAIPDIDYIRPAHLQAKLRMAIGYANGPDPAVAGCCAAYVRRFLRARNRRALMPTAARLASEAYCHALPRVVDAKTARQLAACVETGLHLEAIDPQTARLLTYGVRIHQKVDREIPNLRQVFADLPIDVYQIFAGIASQLVPEEALRNNPLQINSLQE